MNRLHSILTLCMVSFILSFSEGYGEDKKCHSFPESTCARNELIVKSFESGNLRSGKKYTTITDVQVFKKILTGIWRSEPHGMAVFKKNGEFQIYHSYIDSHRNIKTITYSGKWDVKENSLWLQYNKVGPWKKYEIEYYQLRDATKAPGADLFDPPEFRYFFEIFFKNGEPWFEDLSFEFNVDK